MEPATQKATDNPAAMMQSDSCKVHVNELRESSQTFCCSLKNFKFHMRCVCTAVHVKFNALLILLSNQLAYSETLSLGVFTRIAVRPTSEIQTF